MSVIDIRNVSKVYRGKAHRCYCGCAGEYKDTDRAKARAIADMDDILEGKREGWKLELERPDFLRASNGVRDLTIYLKGES